MTCNISGLIRGVTPNRNRMWLVWLVYAPIILLEYEAVRLAALQEINSLHFMENKIALQFRNNLKVEILLELYIFGRASAL